MNIPLLAARIAAVRRLKPEADPDDYDKADFTLPRAEYDLLHDFTLAVANGALKGPEAQLGASMVCEAFNIRSNSH